MHKAMRKKLGGLFASLAILLAASLMMAQPAYATSTPGVNAVASAAEATSTATIEAKTGNKGDTLNAYKIVKVTYADNQLTYEFTPTFAAFLAAADAAAPYKSMTAEQYTTLPSDDATFKQMLGDFSAYVKKNNVAISTTDGDKTATTNDAGVATFTGVGLGQYAIVGMGNVAGARIYSTVTAEVVPHIDDTTTPPSYKIYDKYAVDLKTTEPGGEKDIVSGTTDDDGNPTASVGDAIAFRLSGDVPTYPAGTTNKTLFMSDELTEGLTLDPSSVKVYKGADAANKTELTANTDYTLTIDGQTLYVDFVYDNVVGSDKIFVEYTATLNEKAKVGSTTGNPNDFTYTYSNNPFNGETHEHDDIPEGDNGYGHKEDSETVYSYGLYIYKTAAGSNPVKPLQGAKFELKVGDKVIAILTTDANGYAAYNGLEKGTYTLHEIEAPTGYKLAPDVTVDLSNATATSSTTTTTQTLYTADPNQAAVQPPAQATNADGVLLWVPKTGSGLVAAATNPDPTKFDAAYLKSTTTTVNGTVTPGAGAGAGYYPANIEDNPGGNLPTTGGMGTYLIYGIGGALVIGAVVMYSRKRKLSSLGE